MANVGSWGPRRAGRKDRTHPLGAGHRVVPALLAWGAPGAEGRGLDKTPGQHWWGSPSA